MVPVSLYDTVELERTDTDVITVEAVGSAHVGNDEDNICHRAARYFFTKTGIYGGVHIRIHKRIPVGAGLGGGSSNAASVARSRRG